MQVPVKPVCPNALGETPLPVTDFGVARSKPKPLPFKPLSAAKRCTVSGENTLTPPYEPPFNHICPKIPKSCAVENNPALPATPPSIAADWSCTSPTSSCLRQNSSFSDGTILFLSKLFQALKSVLNIPSGR